MDHQNYEVAPTFSDPDRLLEAWCLGFFEFSGHVAEQRGAFEALRLIPLQQKYGPRRSCPAIHLPRDLLSQTQPLRRRITVLVRSLLRQLEGCGTSPGMMAAATFCKAAIIVKLLEASFSSSKRTTHGGRSL